MAKFSRVEHVLTSKVYDVKQMPGCSPDDYLESIGIENRELKLPTVCAVNVDDGETLFLGREEWGTILSNETKCLFITYPRSDNAGNLFGEKFAKRSGSLAIQLKHHYLKLDNVTTPEIAPRQILAEAKPTYELNARRNNNRLDQPLVVHYGRVRAYLDLGMNSYNEFIGNDQFLFTLLVLGEGSFETETLQIDDTDITSFEGVTLAILPPGSPPTLVEIVETSPDIANIELTNAFKGPFTATAVGFSADRIDLDFSFPSGLQDGGGSESVTVIGEVRRIDDNGDPIGGFIEVFNEIITDATNSTINETRTFNVVPGEEGRYEARMRRIGETSTSTSVIDKVSWTGLRAYLASGHPDYGDRTLLEIKIKATEQLNSTNFGIFNIIAKRKIQVFNGSTFDFVASSSVVWAFYDLVTNAVYGTGLDPDDRLDIDDLFILSGQFDALGHECNLRFENSMSAMTAFAQIAQCARSEVFQKGGKLWLVRDEPKVAITAFYTHTNIAPGSLVVTWQLPSIIDPNFIEVTYLDQVTWKNEVVSGLLPDTVPTIAREIRLLGVTDRQKAWELAQFYAAQDRHRRKIIEFTTDIEGYLPDFKDHISVSHDSLVQFVNGTVQDYDNITGDFFLDNPPDFKGAEFGYISFKALDGSMVGPFTCVPGDTSYKVRVPCFDDVDNPLITQISQPNKEPTRFSFGHGNANEASRIFVVLDIQSNGDNSVTIKAVNNDPRVFTSDVGIAPPIGEPFQPLP